MEAVTIKKAKTSKKQEDIDWEFVESIKRSLEDLKAGRFTEWKPKRVK